LEFGTVAEILDKAGKQCSSDTKHDVMDWTSMRVWLNTPLGLSIEQEIYKSSNVLTSYCQIVRLKPERSIFVSILQGSHGLAIFIVAKDGIGITYKLGTGV
jgi:hypothetical protein